MQILQNMYEMESDIDFRQAIKREHEINYMKN